jgi:Tfp pilus assembly protein PilF
MLVGSAAESKKAITTNEGAVSGLFYHGGMPHDDSVVFISMSLPDGSKTPAPDSEPVPSRMSRLFGWVRRRAAFDAREQWWRLLDLIEEKRRFRWSLYAAFAAVVLGAVAAIWVYPWWHQRNAISIARGWLVAGRLDHAAEAVKDALDVAPELPESWQLAADLARLGGNKSRAVDCSRHAATLSPGNRDLTLAWAADALNNNQPEEAEHALSTLEDSVASGSPHAQRIFGEIARRRGDFARARDHFETALKLDGPLPIDEVPLGIVLLHARDKTERQRGLDFLAKWAPDREWGANALRALLADASTHADRAAMLRWADALRAHPRCTLGDIPNCLLALSKTDESRFTEVLTVMEKHHAVDSGNVALLVSWLNQIGRSREAIQWIKTLPPSLTSRPPAAVSIAESLRQLADWPALLDWTKGTDWGSDLEPIRIAYELRTAHATGITTLADELWKTLQSRAATDSGRALVTADLLYGWGMLDQALALLWIASDQPEIAVDALGTLARHYQVSNDANGQYQVFKRLHSLRAQDASIANNYAFFSALTGNDLNSAEQIAKDNFTTSPDNLAYRSTYALVLCTQNRATEALVLFRAATTDWKNYPVIALPYCLALAGTRQKDEAREVLSSIPPETLTTQEASLIKKVLN